MEKTDVKAAMMHLLREDTEVQRLIRGICDEKSETRKTSLPDPLPSVTEKSEKGASKGLFWKSDKGADTDHDQLRAKLAASEQERRDQSDTIALLKKKAASTAQALAKVERENDKLSADLDKEKETVRDLTTKSKKLEASCNALRESADALEKKAARLKRENEEQAQMLSQRFADGWELFCAYRKVSAPSKRLLSGVFVKSDDFTSFICGCAQDRSLEKIWDVIKGCLAQGDTNDAEILWDIFEYAVELVNSAKTERIYEIMDATPGIPFDLDCHALTAESKAQGTIQEVYLLGYQNIYANRVERKSIVRV